MSQGSTWWWW